MPISMTAAYHEAGHAVLVYKSSFFNLIGEIALLSEGAGHQNISLSKSKVSAAGKQAVQETVNDPEVASEFSVILMSGRMAEEIAMCDGYDPQVALDSARNDYQEAKHILTNAGLDTDITIFEERARQLLTEHWEIVSIVAEELYSAECMLASDVIELIEANI